MTAGANGDQVELFEYPVLAAGGLAMALVCLYGLHRYGLVYLYFKHRDRIPRVHKPLRTLPRVTVQLPMYNERYVATRIIEQTCRLNYPRDLLQIQVLDDSTDETVEIAQEAVSRMQDQGIDIVYLHREDRSGYKAGALEEGLKTATGEFIAIFDADFLPEPEILNQSIHHFGDKHIGMVQARWEHINREHSLLTETQAILLDGHFVIEHGARCRSGRFMSFNGTAGIWRRQCIVEAGGWQHDTLTEDLDLSYRAQLKGWEFVFLPQVASPAELPPEMNAFKTQQHRWAKGGAQTCRKLLPLILRSRVSGKIKLEAFFHLTSCVVYLCMVLLVVLLFPMVYLSYLHGGAGKTGVATWLLDICLFMVATCSAGTFYACSQRELLRTWGQSVKYLPFLMSLGVGISINNARAALEGFLGWESEFVRTPKFGVKDSRQGDWRSLTGYLHDRKVRLQAWIELAIGVYLSACVIFCIHVGWITLGVPFMILFAAGFLYVGIQSLIPADARGHSGGAGAGKSSKSVSAEA